MSLPLRVLLVEDHDDDAFLLVRHLKRGGYDVTSRRVETAEEMAAALQGGPWDLVLSDYYMPRFSVFAALQLVHDRGLDLPFIIVSASIGEEAAVAAMRAGANDYVIKNNLGRLIPAIQRELREAEERQARRRMETALREAEERYQALFQRSLDYLCIIDLEGRFIDANPALCNTLGTPVEALRGLVLFNLLAPAQFAQVTTLRAEILAKGQMQALAEFQIPRPAGPPFEVECMGTLILHDGRPHSIQCVARDITARKQALAALRDSERWLATTLDGLNEGVLTLDQQQRVVRLNCAARPLLAVAPEVALGQPLQQVLAAHDPDGGAPIADLCAHLRGVAPAPRELLLKGSHGPPRRVATSLTPLHDDAPVASGQPDAGSVVLLRDVTAQHELEEQLRFSQKMEAVGRLARGVVHDFNNALSIISGTCDVLLYDLPESDPLRADVAEVVAATERAANLTRQLAAFSRRQPMQAKVVALNELVGGMQRLIGRVLGEDIDFRVRVDARAGQVRLDPGQLEQVIMKLALNARDAMPGGGQLTIETGTVTVTAEMTSYLPGLLPGEHAVITVTDSGQGMTSAVRAKIFEPFFTTKTTGTGLGLSVAYGIVAQSGGAIRVQSEPGKGSTFHLYFPRVDAQPETTDDEVLATMPRGRDETVLLVEDEEPLRELLGRILRMSGYQVMLAAHGGEALVLAERLKQPIDLLVTDVIMPQMNGRELAHELCQRQPRVRVLYMSGYGDEVIGPHGLLEPDIELIYKPFTARALMHKVRGVLDR